MLSMATLFHGPPGQQPEPGALDFPRSPQKLPSASEAESEASMSEASSEDLVLPLEVAPGRESDKAAKKEKKKKSRGLASVFSVFTKGRKKKPQPSSAEAEGEPEPRPQLADRLPTVEELKADLERGRLEAAGPLLALERELQAAAAAGGASAEELVRRQSKVEALYLLLRDQVLGLLRRPLEAPPERLRQALAVLAEQEREDRAAEAAAAGGPGPASLAPTRPRRWLQAWRRGVAQAAEERMSRRPAADAEGRSEAERVFVHMGRTMREDLEAVVERLKPLFPPELGVVAAYAESYHEYFAAQLEAVAQFELCPRDTYMLLVWVQNLYPKDVINSPKLAGELQGVGLGSLLPPKQIRLLEATFFSNEAASMRELMARALDLELKCWDQDAAPQKLDGHCHSELAIDIIQIISQGQAKAEEITPDVGAQMKRVLQVELAAVLRSYQRAFDDFLESSKHLGNYRANVIANINNCLSFRMFMEQKWQTAQDLLSHLLNPLNELKSRGFDTLLQGLFGDLKPLFKKLSQTRWAAPAQTLEQIICAVRERLPEFEELHDCFREELMEVIHLHLVKEYIIRLSKRRLVLRTPEQQQQLAGHILANAELIQNFCTENVSPAHPSLRPAPPCPGMEGWTGCPPPPGWPLWASPHPIKSDLSLSGPPGGPSGKGQPFLQPGLCSQGSPATWLHRALPTLAEIIRLQDPSAIKIEVATYATWYPDFSKGHLSAILAIKGNLSSSEVKSIRSILDINTGAHEPSKPLFSLINVG